MCGVVATCQSGDHMLCTMADAPSSNWSSPSASSIGTQPAIRKP